MKKLKINVIFLVSAILFTNILNAQSLAIEKNVADLEVSYLGADEEYLTFKVDIVGTNDKYIRFKISDRKDGELYAQNYNKKTPYLVFKIEKQEGQEIVFKLYDGKNVISKIFVSTKKVLEEINVKEKDIVVL